LKLSAINALDKAIFCAEKELGGFIPGKNTHNCLVGSEDFKQKQ
jgi:hypothetical protein